MVPKLCHCMKKDMNHYISQTNIHVYEGTLNKQLFSLINNNYYIYYDYIISEWIIYYYMYFLVTFEYR